VSAALDSAVEGLGDDPGAHSLQPAGVELAFAQDVEPQRRVPEEALALRLRQQAEVGAVLAVPNLGLRQLRDIDALPLEEGGHLLAGGKPDHPRARQVAEGEVAPGIVLRHVGSAEGGGGEGPQRVDESGVDPHRAVELVGGHREPRLVRLLEVVQPAPVRDPGARQTWPAAEITAPRREQEQEVERSSAEVEDRVPVVLPADHRVPEPEGGHRELDRHRRHIGGGNAHLELPSSRC
jgi:hypothetical protein